MNNRYSNEVFMFIYQKLIDRSTLRQGFQIPVEFHHLLKAKPVFDRPSLSFHFPNGLVEKVKIDKHLANG